MGNRLYALGLDFFEEKEDTFAGLLLHVAGKGKAVTGYYGLPYLNKHFGATQMIVRTAHGEENKLEIAGFDTHCDSMTVWKLRVSNKLANADEKDLTNVRILGRQMDGNNILHIDVLNGDVLPSFKEDEVIFLQMVAFSEDIHFYANADEYAETVEPWKDGERLLPAMNSVFPAGLFQEDEELKDVVQIFGEVKKLDIGSSVFNDKKYDSFIECLVETQLGEITIIFPFEDIDQIRNDPNIAVGRVVNCYARLSGDAAVMEYEDGIVKNPENNLRLVAYTLETGDPDRLRSVLTKDFVYASEDSGKRITDPDELIAFFRKVQKEAEPAHTSYATITSVDEGPEGMNYPVGTRCALIRYGDRKDFNAIAFVDTDEEGNIGRIQISCNTRYHFRVDPPLPAPGSDEEYMEEEVTFQEAVLARAHLEQILANDITAEQVEQFMSDHEYELKMDAAKFQKQFHEWRECLEEIFLYRVRKSNARFVDEKRLRWIAGRFFDETIRFKTSKERAEHYDDSLMLVEAIGLLYSGETGSDQKGTD